MSALEKGILTRVQRQALLLRALVSQNLGLKWAIFLTLLASLAAVMYGAWMYREPLSRWFFEHGVMDIAPLVLGAISLVYFIGRAFFSYLRPVEISPASSVRASLEVPLPQLSEVDTLERQSRELNSLLLRAINPEGRAALEEYVRAHLRGEAVADLMQQLEERFKPAETIHRLERALGSVIVSAERRLSDAITAAEKRGLVNLFIGILTTSIAVILLAALVWPGQAPRNVEGQERYITILEYYLPRMSIAIFVEVFAFFFLRLYRDSLKDIRYYQDELTELSLLHFGISGVQLADKKETLISLIQHAQGNRKGVTFTGEHSPQAPLDLEKAGKLLEALAKFTQSKS